MKLDTHVEIPKYKLVIIFISVIGVGYLIYSQGVIIQEQDYHQFADSRKLMGIHNAMDVLSNFLFLVVGMLGLRETAKNNPDFTTRSSWSCFFLSVLLIAPGSAYYHMSPTDSALVWDRLPMSMAFMSMYVALLAEHFSQKFERALFPSIFIGVSSVVVWVISGDLRFYFLIQLSSFVVIPLVLLLFTSRYTHKIYFFLAILGYGLAKLSEAKDLEIYQTTQGIISGHSLKHMLAAGGLMSLYWMIRQRSPAPALFKA